MADPAADWYPDPTGRHEYRYWDGSAWTDHVADAGEASTDPIAASTSAAQEDPTAQQTAAAQPADVAVPVDSGGSGGEPVGAVPPSARIAHRQSDGAFAGIRGDLVSGDFTEHDRNEVAYLQNSKMLKVELGPDCLARQGAMVAFQGQVDFDYEGSGGLGKLFKKAVTGEGLPLMRCRGEGEVFLARNADDVHILWLDGGGITVNGENVLAFSSDLDWDIERIQGAGRMAGGMYNTVLRGHGWVAVTTDGSPVVLDTSSKPTFADMDAAVAWSSNLRTSVNATFKLGSLVGRGSGEIAQLAFSGQGYVIVQPSEGASGVPPHEHGGGGSGGGGFRLNLG